jgi:hypothetical protein
VKEVVFVTIRDAAGQEHIHAFETSVVRPGSLIVPPMIIDPIAYATKMLKRPNPDERRRAAKELAMVGAGAEDTLPLLEAALKAETNEFAKAAITEAITETKAAVERAKLAEAAPEMPGEGDPAINPDGGEPAAKADPASVEPAVKADAWTHLQKANFTAMDGFIRNRVEKESEPHLAVATIESYSGPIEVTATLRLQSPGGDLRLFGFGSGLVIFNPGNPGGAKASAFCGRTPPTGTAEASWMWAAVPRRSKAWTTVKWRVTTAGMDLYVNGQRVFTEKRRFDLSRGDPVRISGRWGGEIDIRSFEVKRLE